MTSNIGSQYLLEGIDENGEIKPEAQEQVMNDLRGHFRPEFLNRLDEIILFKPLTKDNIGGIVDLMVKELSDRLADQELSLELTDAARTQVIENGYDPVYGARPLKRYLQNYVETLAAKKIHFRGCSCRRYTGTGCQRRRVCDQYEIMWLGCSSQSQEVTGGTYDTKGSSDAVELCQYTA